MSKNPSIQEGGEPKTISNVSKLRTALDGGGTQLWIPEDEAINFVNLGTKSINENGTYNASGDGLDGFSSVSVNIPSSETAKLDNKNITQNGTYYARDDNLDGYDTINVNVTHVTGTDPEDGEEKVVSVDPETGELEETRVPVRIEITKEPDKLDYEDGETINPTGIIVHAYYADGSDYGTVLNSELRYEPENASGGGGGGGVSDLDLSPVTQPVPFSTVATLTRGEETFSYYCENGVVTQTVEGKRGCQLFASETQNAFWYGIRPEVRYDYTGTCSRSYEHNGKTVYYHYRNGGYSSVITEADPNLDITAAEFTNQELAEKIAWTIIFGASSGTGTVTVSWPRIGDGKILTDTFDITVSPAEESSAENEP